ncbi:hypothetical protein [Aestuariirhabdus litorea]|uniref:Uncharacterized protein n=1 Tax=Aestuariirhabdus litorea TaxID=2528527 RepID=A0A3P3VLT4_9GAMM|nr:hypothetical protein [Aestuariirhabdus litorea]RRJ82838.1 hypothetical protein D0544_13390 [Aestuariirhabdus litorea]RWW92997.1 hypothetical protein DZC74_13365 [Endozoicomonadaceae bacterium GTF-13]
MSDTGTLYVKTPKGIEAVGQRNQGLPARARQMLLLVDGKRDLEALTAMLPGDRMKEALDQLLADGYITPLKSDPPKAGLGFSLRRAVPDEGPKPKDDNERIELARNFMVNTTRTFIGYTGEPLIQKVEACQTISELQSLFDDWRETVKANPEGSQRMSELEPRLAALIS